MLYKKSQKTQCDHRSHKMEIHILLTCLVMQSLCDTFVVSPLRGMPLDETLLKKCHFMNFDHIPSYLHTDPLMQRV